MEMKLVGRQPRARPHGRRGSAGPEEVEPESTGTFPLHVSVGSSGNVPEGEADTLQTCSCRRVRGSESPGFLAIQSLAAARERKHPGPFSPTADALTTEPTGQGST